MHIGSPSRLRLLALTGVLALGGTGVAVAATHGGAADPAAAQATRESAAVEQSPAARIPTGTGASSAAPGLGEQSTTASGGAGTPPSSTAPARNAAGSTAAASPAASIAISTATSPTASQSQSQTAAAGTKSVSYLGHTFTVPADWSVVNLSQAPHTCVRFDAHALYLGTPSSEQSCAEQTAAPVEAAIVVQPAAATAATSQDNPVERRITATLPNAGITASYGAADRSEVTGILAGAGVPAPVVTQAAAGTSATTGVARQNLTPYTGTITPALVAKFTVNAHGTGFDTCDAPSTDDMAAWGASPYMGIGVYFGGAERACAQENLNASWVSTETAAGWHLLPLYIGLQVVNDEVTTTSGAAAQGKAAAEDAVTQASSLGIGQGAVLYYDMENHTDGSAFTAAEVTATQQFVTGWTAELHALGYLSGLYGNENGAQGAMVSGEGKSGVTEPDMMDVANWNGQQDDDPGSDPAGYWNLHRVHQFDQINAPVYGGVTLDQIDEDYFDLGQDCLPTATATGGVARSRVSEPCVLDPVG